MKKVLLIMAELNGLTLVAVRPISKTELEVEGWEEWGRKAVCLEFHDGTIIYASGDEEGNKPGALFGKQGEEAFALY